MLETRFGIDAVVFEDGHLRDAWIDNLRQMHVYYLFVSRLSAYEIDYVWHNDAGFPIEDEWAKADPQTFRLIYENQEVRIYAISLPARVRG